MLRLVIAGLLTATLGACSHREDAPVVQPGASAGNVVEVTGTVTATGPTGPRKLARGDSVTADDAIDTGTGSVAIVLAHNAARWELGPDHHNAKVRESAAWKLAKQDGVAKPVDLQTTPAGREAEHTAVDTVATTSSTPKVDMSEPPKPTAPAPTAPPPPTIQPTEAPVTAHAKGGAPGGGPSDKGDAGSANKGVGSVRGAPNIRATIPRDPELRACLTKKAHLVIACATSTCKVTSNDITEQVRRCVVGHLDAMMLGDLSLTVDVEPAPPGL